MPNTLTRTRRKLCKHLGIDFVPVHINPIYRDEAHLESIHGTILADADVKGKHEISYIMQLMVEEFLVMSFMVAAPLLKNYVNVKLYVCRILK